MRSDAEYNTRKELHSSERKKATVEPHSRFNKNVRKSKHDSKVYEYHIIHIGVAIVHTHVELQCRQEREFRRSEK